MLLGAKNQNMRIKITRQAAESGTLRVWLPRIPEKGGIVHACRMSDDGKEFEEVASASLYGRGVGSSAIERAMLLFRLPIGMQSGSIKAGQELELCWEYPEGGEYIPASFEILKIE